MIFSHTRAVIIATAFLGALASHAQHSQEAVEYAMPEEALLKMIPYFSQDEQPISKVFQAVGRTYGLSIICDEDVVGIVDVEFHHMTLRGILDAMCASRGYFWDLEESGYVTVKRFKTIIYHIEYPQLERRGSSKSSIQLGQTNYNASAAGGGGGGGGSSGQRDDASISLSSDNDNQFWKSIEAELREFKGKDERIIFDRFSGTIAATASRHTHEYIERFLNTVNARIGQQVEIIGRLVEVQLHDENKLGIDWTTVGAKIGEVAFSLGSSTMFSANKVGGHQFSPNTVVGTISGGKIAGMFEALSEQGDLNTVTAPRLVTLNNQTAYIKDTEDRPYFQLRQSSANTTSGAGGSNTYQSDQYDVQTISIGTLVAITPHVSDNGDITLDVIPAITRFKEDIKVNNDDRLKAPALYVKTTSTIVRLRSGETAIIGGIVSDSTAGSVRSVPGLGKLPLLGRLFRSDGRVKTKTELVIMLTPRILVPGSSLSAQATAEAERDSRAVRAYAGETPATGESKTVNAYNGISRPVESISLID